MSDKVDFKKLWNKQQSEIPDAASLYKKANKLKLNYAYTLGFLLLIVLLTSLFIACVWYYSQPQLMVTKIGMVIAILSMWIHISNYRTTLPLLKSNLEMNSKNYVQQLIQLKEKQLVIQTKKLNTYFILLLIGLCMSLYEYISKFSLLWFIIFYALIFIWFAVNWFYLRPMIIKKQQSKIYALIKKFDLVNNQFETAS